MQATVALAGNPNSGKTTLFNELTGARQHVGNYPGVTVEKKEGTYTHKDFKLHVVDLPGTYSLTAYSLEEVVARDYLVNEKPEVVINIVDSSNLERNLYLAVQFLEMGIPVCIALNMIDVAKKRGIEINAEKLSTLLGVPVVPTIARTGKGKQELMESAAHIVQAQNDFGALKISYGDDVDRAMLDMQKEIEAGNFLVDTYPARWVALKYMEKDEQILSQGKKLNPDLAARLEETVKKVSSHLLNTLDTYPEAMIADQRYGFINSILKQGVIFQKYDQNRLYSSDKIDRVLTNRFLGPIIMLAVIAGLFHVVFTYSEIPVSLLESIFGWISHGLYTILPDGLLRSLLVSGFRAVDHVHVFWNCYSRGFRLPGPGRIYAGQGISDLWFARQFGDGFYRFGRHRRGLCGSGCDGHPYAEIPARVTGDPSDRAVYELRSQAAGVCPVDRCVFCKV
jgi:ferrous iron transport protein B